MLCRVLILSLPLVPVLSSAEQLLRPEFELSDQPDRYEFKWPVTKVAIIGAGVSGLIAYREFTGAGFEHVRVFERDNATMFRRYRRPCATLPVEEHYDSGWEARWREHRAPKPVWESLESVDPPISEIPWPLGTPWPLPHRTLARYLRAFASFHGANSNDANPDVAYNTRVERVEKRYDDAGLEHGWTLTLKRLERTGQHSGKATWWNEDFDAIVVATGRYNAPNIPYITGLEEWAKIFPGSIIHSRQYRRPQPFINETILVVGGAVSGVTVAPNPHLPYGAVLVQLKRLPANVSVVPEIRRFHACNGSVELVNGTFLHAISRIIFATGFRYSFPFLPQFHNTSDSESPHPIVTDGSHLRSLYEDFVYIDEPTIGFLNSTPSRTPSTCPWRWRRSGRVRLAGGYGRHLQFLGAKRAAESIRFFVAWLNDAAVKFGGRQIDGESKDLPQIWAVWTQARYGVTPTQQDSGDPRNDVVSVDWIHGGDW
ncbi:hypothetical protein B0H14DRAFT_2790468 [Mycena olivaceomarginata]|nr:hypothetical protein B0H14DRAFT_2790468 [Mycena olivaceomarginata]